MIALPIRDYSVPSHSEFIRAVNAVIGRAQAGCNSAIHCSAGIGWTGLFVAFVARQVFSFSGEDAVAWGRQYIPGAVEMAVLRNFVIGDTLPISSSFKAGL